MGLARIRTLTGATILFVTLGYGLYPFNFLSENDVVFDDVLKATRFHGKAGTPSYAQRGIAYTRNAIQLPVNRPFTIEVEAIPEEIPSGLGTLLEIHDGAIQPPLIIAQWREHLAIRSRRARSPAERPYQEIGLPDSLRLSRPAVITLTDTGSATRIYQNGELAITRRGFSLIEGDAPLHAHLVIGNSASGQSPWLGAMRRVALYEGSFSPSEKRPEPLIEYNFDKPFSQSIQNSGSLGYALRIDPRFRPLERKRFSPLSTIVDKEKRQSSDIVVNFFGFLPASVVICLFTRSRVRSRWLWPFITAAGAFGLSFAIESAQIALPSRSPSQVDLLVNTLAGWTTGIAFCLAAKRARRKPPPPRLELPIE